MEEGNAEKVVYNIAGKKTPEPLSFKDFLREHYVMVILIAFCGVLLNIKGKSETVIYVYIEGEGVPEEVIVEEHKEPSIQETIAKIISLTTGRNRG